MANCRNEKSRQRLAQPHGDVRKIVYISKLIIWIGRIHVCVEGVNHFKASVDKFRVGEELMELSGRELRHHVSIYVFAVDFLSRQCSHPVYDRRKELIQFKCLNVNQEESNVQRIENGVRQP